jgi:flagellar hook-length control protein FliK
MQMTLNETSAARAAPQSPPKADNNTDSNDSNDKSFQDSLDSKVHADREKQKVADEQQNGTNSVPVVNSPAAPVQTAEVQQEIAFAMQVANAQSSANQNTTSIQQIMQEITQALQQTDNQAETPVTDLVEQLQNAAPQTKTGQTDVKIDVSVNPQVSLQMLANQETGSKVAATLNMVTPDVKTQSDPSEKLVLQVPEKSTPKVDTNVENALSATQVQAAKTNFLEQLNTLQKQGDDTQTLILNQISDKVKSTLQSGKDVVNIQLQPENLGKVDVRIVRGSDGVQFFFTADSLATSKLLQSSMNQLHQSLVDAGVKVGNMSVAYQGQQSQQNKQGQPKRNNSFSFWGDDSDLVTDFSPSSALSAIDTRA